MLSAPDGYRAWASHYSTETAVSFLEDALVREFDVPTAGRAILDAGCGTGRRLANTDAALAVGVDLTPGMLAESASAAALAVLAVLAVFAVADVRALPFDDAAFDVVWCRLVIGHLREIGIVYDELARVCRSGGAVVITDFHPAAVTAGHRRTFRDNAGVVRELEHYAHLPAAHATAAAHARLVHAAQREGDVGPAIRHFYADAGKSDVYDAQLGLPIVLAIAYRKE